jgi:hypothetical protein
MHIVQYTDHDGKRAVGLLRDGKVTAIAGYQRVTDLAAAAASHGKTIADLGATASGLSIAFDHLVQEGRILPPVDHADPSHCLVTGTGLTHLGSAAARDEMHKKAQAATGNETDSIKMFNMGLKGGKPTDGRPGVQPEWFYKGDGSTVVPPYGDLPSPAFAMDGGEEPEIAGIYWIGPNGVPYRLGYALGNEFSDHVMERQNYLYLAHSKLRACSIGPVLRLGPLPIHVEGMSRILRDGKVLWEKPFVSAEANMSHTLENLEYHHFKYELFRKPGDIHIHFFGTATLSVADNVITREGDIFEIESKEFGPALRNRLASAPSPLRYGGVRAL